MEELKKTENLPQLDTHQWNPSLQFVFQGKQMKGVFEVEARTPT